MSVSPPRTPQEYAVACLPTAHKLARMRTRDADLHEDLVQLSIIALMEAVQRSQELGKTIEKPYSWAKKVLFLAMRDYLVLDRVKLEVNVEEPIEVEVPATETEQEEALFFSAYYAEIERVLGEEARRVAENLCHPSPAVVNLALLEMEDKKLAKAAGKSVHGFATLRIKQTHIRDALSMSQFHFDNTLRKVREFTRAYLAAPTYA